MQNADSSDYLAPLRDAMQELRLNGEEKKPRMPWLETTAGILLAAGALGFLLVWTT
jgi:hypothetical protein